MEIKRFLFLLIFLPLMAAAAKLDPRLTRATRAAVPPTAATADFLRKTDAGLTVRALLTFDGDLRDLREMGGSVVCSRGDIAVVDIPEEALARAASLPSVVYLEAPPPSRPMLDKSKLFISAVKAREQRGVTGRGVIVGIIDSGIDWTHHDFRRPDGSTRIKAMLDLSRSGSTYGGIAYTESQINAALRGGAPIGMKDVSGHGTHVAGIAAGDGSSGSGFGDYAGVAPEADLVIVKAARDLAGREFRTADQIIGLTFIDSVAQQLAQPYVANLSLGGHSGAHDGTSAVERYIDALVGSNVAGKAVVTVAGNDGNTSVHAQAQITDNKAVITFRVGGYPPNSGSDNDQLVFDGWYDGAQKIGVTLISPSGASYGPALPGSVFDKKTPDGSIYMWNGFYEDGESYRAGVNPLNGDREIYLQISDENGAEPPTVGEWQMVFSGSGGTIDVWITDATMDFSFVRGEVESGTLSIPGTSRNAVTVASFISKRSWQDLDGNNLTYDSGNLLKEGQLSPFSSQGPVRKGGYLKPEIAAPGQIIAAALSADSPADGAYSIFNPGKASYPRAFINKDGAHGLSSGTSMAAPHVAGSIALLFEQNPHYSAQQIKEVIAASARTDIHVGAAPNPRWGWGKLDVLQALAAEPPDDAATHFKLLTARPNPFINQTAITYELAAMPAERLCEIDIYNAVGRKVRSLVHESKNPGSYTVYWDGRDQAGTPAASGVYMIRMKIGEWKAVKKVVYLGSNS